MPAYPYTCNDCEHDFDVVKRVAHIDEKEACPVCEGSTTRTIALQQSFYGADDWNNQTYDPAFGQVVKGNAHRRKLAKERGWIEIGNERPEKIHRHYEEQKDCEIENRWAKV